MTKKIKGNFSVNNNSSNLNLKINNNLKLQKNGNSTYGMNITPFSKEITAKRKMKKNLSVSGSVTKYAGGSKEYFLKFSKKIK